MMRVMVVKKKSFRIEKRKRTITTSQHNSTGHFRGLDYLNEVGTDSDYCSLLEDHLRHVKTQVWWKSDGGYVFSRLWKLFFPKGLLTNLKSFWKLLYSSNKWVIYNYCVFQHKLYIKTYRCEIFQRISSKK